MARQPDPVNIARSHIAIYSRKDKRGDPAKVLIARRELALAKLERHVREVVEDLAPLTTEERTRVVMLLMADSEVA